MSFMTLVTAAAFHAVGDIAGNFAGAHANLGGHRPLRPFSEARFVNIAGHAAVGCASAVASGGKCGPGAASGADVSFAGPPMADMGFQRNVVARAAVGGRFGNGAVTAAFGLPP